ncbi:MAG TPA: hypothetical protein V6D46_07490 [Coleofasciculaceae cyanobacterium]
MVWGWLDRPHSPIDPTRENFCRRLLRIGSNQSINGVPTDRPAPIGRPPPPIARPITRP